MQWAVVKIVEGKLLGCVIGPFPTKDAAEEHGERAGRFDLGYEKWVACELQPPADLTPTYQWRDK